jgi:hypothetical protein
MIPDSNSSSTGGSSEATGRPSMVARSENENVRASEPPTVAT